MKIVKIFSALMGCLLIGNMSFAGSFDANNAMEDTLLTKASPFQQETKFAVITGTIIDNLNARTVLIAHENRMVAGSLKYGAPENGTAIHAAGTYEGTINYNSREFPHYRLTRVVLD